MTSRVRLWFLNWFFVALFLVLIAKLFYWQVLAQDTLSQIALNQQQTTLEVPARRGDILFSDGSPLATSQPTWLAYLVRGHGQPDLTQWSEKLAGILYPQLALSGTPSAQLNPSEVEALTKKAEAALDSRLSDENINWISLGSRVNLAQKLALDGLKLDSLWLEPTQGRFYPEASMAAHLLGFVGLDSRGKDKGYYGLEGYYNLELSGRPGVIREEKDAFNQPIVSGDFSAQSKKDGRTLELNIDKGLQFIVESKLEKGVERYGAKAGSVTVMDPYTGAVLAMASLPGYDPVEYNRYQTENYLNPVVADAFEPGSIFKVMVMAAGIDSGVVKPETVCDICDGPAKIDKYEIKTWNNEYHPNSTMTDVIIHSDNVGMVFVGQKLGVDRFLDYFHRFGFTESTGIDLEDENIPQPKPDNKWTYVDVATGSFGQGFLATGMQLLTAVSAIGNGGELVQPRLVKEIISEGHPVQLPQKIKHRVISEETAREIKDIMVAAAGSGEAKWADIKGYKIAGKTGTAQVAVGGKYAEEKTNASFVGFAPADHPKFAMLVTLREPSTSQWASETAAPLWFSIAQDLFNHFNVVPQSQ